MGKAGILLIASTTIIAFTMFSSAWTGSLNTERAGNSHSAKTMARQVAMTGFNLTIHKLDASEGGWRVDPTAYEVQDQAYQHGTYSVDIDPSYGSSDRGGCIVDTVDVLVTANVSEVEHNVQATYIRSCGTAGEGLPPGYNSNIASGTDQGITDQDGGGTDEGGTLNNGPVAATATASSSPEFGVWLTGEPRFFASTATENVNLHTNGMLAVLGKAQVEGFGTYVKRKMCFTCDGFLPNDDINGPAPNVYGVSPLDIPTVEVPDYEAGATYIHKGDLSWTGSQVIDFTDFQGITGYGTLDKPFIWYVKGDLSVKDAKVTMLGYAVIYVEGYMDVTGAAYIYTSVPNGVTPPSSTYTDPNVDNMRSFIAANMSKGTTVGFYVGGTKEGWLHSHGIHVHAKGVITGQLYARGPVHVHDDATFIGSIVSRSGMHIHGRNVHWYVKADVKTLPPDIQPNNLQQTELAAYTEW